MTIPMQNFEADTLVILKRRDYDAYGKKFLCEKKVFSRFTFIKKLEIYSYVEFYGGFNGTNHLKRSSLVLSLGDFFRTSKKTTNRIYFDLCFKFVNPFQSNSNAEFHDGYNGINRLKRSSLVVTLVAFLRIFKKNPLTTRQVMISLNGWYHWNRLKILHKNIFLIF